MIGNKRVKRYAPIAISSADIESAHPIIVPGRAARQHGERNSIMSRFKIVAIILAGMLAIAPAAFAHGGGGHGGGGFHGGGFRLAHSCFVPEAISLQTPTIF